MRQRFEHYLQELIAFGYVEEKENGEYIRFRLTDEEFLDRLTKSGVPNIDPKDDDDPATFMACQFADMVMREQGIKHNLSDLIGFGDVFLAMKFQTRKAMNQFARDWQNREREK